MQSKIEAITESFTSTLDTLMKDELSFLSQLHAFADQTLPHQLVEYLDNFFRKLIIGAIEHPTHVMIELFLLLVVVYFIFFQRQRDLTKAGLTKSQRPTQKECDELIAEFKSAPFETDAAKHATALDHTPWVVDGYSGPFADVKMPGKTGAVSKRLLNFCGYDFLSLSTDSRILNIAKDTVRAYGVGSCGPRGFYGSMKPHLDLEDDLAKFLGVHSAIMYSFHFATTSTMIPCFSAKGDTILCDSGVNLVVQKGCTLSRSNLSHFRHNDLGHLEELMSKAVSAEKKKGKLLRRFVVTEGVFRNTGELCDLPNLVNLCKKYKFRLVLDDSYGFGVLGATGRGTPEYYGIKHEDIAIYSASLSTSLGIVGGFCAGTDMVVDHQRLAATGYVYSASLPPYVTKSGSAALKILEEEPERVQRLQSNAATFRNFFNKPGTLPKNVKIVSNADVVPLIFFAAKDSASALKERPESDAKFQECVEALGTQHGIFTARAMFNVEEVLDFPPALRVVLKSEVDAATITKAAKAISATLLEVFQ